MQQSCHLQMSAPSKGVLKIDNGTIEQQQNHSNLLQEGCIAGELGVVKATLLLLLPSLSPLRTFVQGPYLQNAPLGGQQAVVAVC